MKKLITLSFVISSYYCNSQVNVSIAGTNRGGEFKMGHLVNAGKFELDIQAGIRGSCQAENPFLESLTVGLPLYVTEEFVVTPAAGYSIYQIQEDKENTTKGTAPYGSVEFGWERIMNDGGRSCLRLFATAQYCKVAAFGVGLRAFFR